MLCNEPMPLYVILFFAAITVAVDATDSSPSRVAAVTESGRVVVGKNGGNSWSPVHYCPQRASDAEPITDSAGEPVSGEQQSTPACGSRSAPAALAWHDHKLFVACSGGGLSVWKPGQPYSEPLANAPTSSVIALGSPVGSRSERLLIADAQSGLWAYSATQGFEYLARAPAPASGVRPTIAAIDEFDGRIAVAGPQAVWRLGSFWNPIAAVAACGLAAAPAGAEHPARLWLAGPFGLLELAAVSPDKQGKQGTPEPGLPIAEAITTGIAVRSIAPATGVAFANGQIFVADGERITTVPAAATAPPVGWATPSRNTAWRLASPWSILGAQPAARIDLAAFRRRQRWSRWLPQLSARFSYYRSRDLTHTSARSHGVELWLRIAWKTR